MGRFVHRSIRFIRLLQEDSVALFQLHQSGTKGLMINKNYSQLNIAGIKFESHIHTMASIFKVLQKQIAGREALFGLQLLVLQLDGIPGQLLECHLVAHAVQLILQGRQLCLYDCIRFLNKSKLLATQRMKSLNSFT